MYNYKALKPKIILYIGPHLETLWEVTNYEEGFIIPSQGDKIMFGKNIYRVNYITHQPEDNAIIISLK